ncbi:MAG: Hpt domain-containing protein [Ardenticatenaceae bacterium]|nr:Hpt domain-containing protein [Ardenticatenaceae bacterium]MCB8988269.1 Hpt domain-containing protein [Ardenticatenaceae bacterium]MCB8988898.1 Hpt domain-containing protein [Ardenticatenaceae bacterium]
MSPFPTPVDGRYPVDLHYAHDIVDGDLELLQELVTLFISDYPPQLTALEQAVAARNAPEVQAKAHRLKCSLGNIGGWQAYKLAYEIELMGLNASLGEAPACLNRLTANIEAIMIFLTQADWTAVAQDWLKADVAS